MKLPEKWCKYLAKQPETGMGYQIVEITYANGTKHLVSIICSEETDAFIDINNIQSMRVIKRNGKPNQFK